VLREVERILPRRNFDFVLCPGELTDKLSPLAVRGIRVVGYAGRTAGDVGAAVRAALAARPT